MRAVKINTTTTQIVKDGKYKPQTPSFTFVNMGSTEVYINNNFLLRPTDRLTVDLTTVVAALMLKDYEVVNDTEFDIKFEGVGFRVVCLIENHVKVV